jgi:hypothetical protein
MINHSYNSQIALIKEILLRDGSVSRNWALSNYISRLGAIIWELKNEGMKIEGKWVKTAHGRDFVYYRIKEIAPNAML